MPGQWHRIFKEQAYDRNRDMARNIVGQAAKQHGCEVYGCKKIPTRFVGSSRIGWLSFCSKHKTVAEAIARYFTQHPLAR